MSCVGPCFFLLEHLFCLSHCKTRWIVSVDDVGLKVRLLGTSNSMMSLPFWPWCKSKWSPNECNNQSQILQDFGMTLWCMGKTTPKGRFTLWPKVKRPLITTNQSARNQEFGLSNLQIMTKVQRPSQYKLITFFVEGDELLVEVWVGREWKPNYGEEAVWFFALKKSIIDKI